MIDSFSNFPAIVPLKTVQGYEIAKAIEENWIKNFGAPKQIHSDNASYFIGAEIKNLLNFYDIRQTNSSPYYPQGNGKVERLMRTIKDMIYSINSETKMDWVDCIPRVEIALRGALHDEYGITAYQYIFGKNMKLGKEPRKDNTEMAENFYKKYKRLFFQSSRNIQQKIVVGSLVMVKIFPVIKSIYSPRFDGPFKVVEVKGGGKSITVIGRNGERTVRNIHHVKKVDFSQLRCNTEKENYEAVLSASPKTEPIEPIVNSRYPKRMRTQNQRYGF